MDCFACARNDSGIASLPLAMTAACFTVIARDEVSKQSRIRGDCFACARNDSGIASFPLAMTVACFTVIARDEVSKQSRIRGDCFASARNDSGVFYSHCERRSLEAISIARSDGLLRLRSQ